MPTFEKTISSDPEILIGRIKDSFPDLNWKTYRYLDEGWDHEVIILDNKIVFRFPNDDQYLLRDEIIVLSGLKPSMPLEIPDYKYIATDFSFAGYPIIAGQPLTKASFDNLTTAEQDKIAEQLAKFLSCIHSLDLKSSYLASVEPSDMAQYQQEIKDKSKDYIKPILSTDDYILLQEIIAEVDELLSKQQPSVFLHGDVYNRHLLWNQAKGRLGIIDFSDMNIGDPAYDFGELYEYGLDFVKQVYGLYVGVKDDSFLARAWVYQKWQGLFMMADYFDYQKTSFEEARQTFDRTKNGI